MKRILRFVLFTSIQKQIMRKVLSLTLIFFCLTGLYAQKKLPEEISVLFLNADEFYDIIDNSGALDDEFTSSGSMIWDDDRYKIKLEGVIDRLTPPSIKKYPDIIGLAGIENKTIINDIISNRKLRKAKYKIAFIDTEGTGVVLLIRDGLFSIKESRLISVDDMYTRDDSPIKTSILYVKAEADGIGTYHFFVNHWPGTINGIRAAENYRLGSAVAVRKEVDRILNFERQASIIIMGSFNDEPTNRSIMSLLNASNKRKNLGERDLYNLHYDRHNNSEAGTVITNGIWQMHDHIIISPSLLMSGSTYSALHESGNICIPEDISLDKTLLKSTYENGKYTGASGKHLAVYFILTRNPR